MSEFHGSPTIYNVNTITSRNNKSIPQSRKAVLVGGIPFLGCHNEGVPQFFVVEPVRLDKFLASSLEGVSRTQVVSMIEEGRVMVGGKPILKPGGQLKEGDEVVVDLPEARAPHALVPDHRELDVVFEDEFLLVVNKPRGLASHPASSLKEPSLVEVLLGRGGTLSTAGGAFRPGIVHRLDKETTGLLVVAKNDEIHRSLAEQIQEKSADRRYLAVSAGDVDQTKFRVEAALRRDPGNRLLMKADSAGKWAATNFKKLARLNAGTLLACMLETGRTHQIRVHLQSIGHPVLGDKLYAPALYRTMPLQLHAAYLRFVHPVTGKEVLTVCPPPADFLGFGHFEMDQLAQW